jgi:entericidin B
MKSDFQGVLPVEVKQIQASRVWFAERHTIRQSPFDLRLACPLDVRNFFIPSAQPAYFGERTMTTISTRIVIALIAALFLTSCANTIRGIGRDTSNAANATEKAAKDVAD